MSGKRLIGLLVVAEPVIDIERDGQIWKRPPG
jgi:hypothetical protein